MKNVVIGLAGVKTSGKSTVAEMIKQIHTNAKESALADKLKNVSAQAFDLKREYFDSQDLKEVPLETVKFLTKPKISYIINSFNIDATEDQENMVHEKLKDIPLETPRRIAQIVGTELLRTFGGEDIHCDQVQINNSGITVISDIRFPNEFKYFNNKDNILFVPLYIQRDLAEKEVDLKTSHPSETLIFTFCDKCIKINNNGSLESTFNQVKSILDKELSAVL